ncbi:MAG: Uma2 family endonuclease, partial [Treponema sp.]|nr:Uma2 family endonuclease [Treponema sp.]
MERKFRLYLDAGIKEYWVVTQNRESLFLCGRGNPDPFLRRNRQSQGRHFPGFCHRPGACPCRLKPENIVGQGSSSLVLLGFQHRK